MKKNKNIWIGKEDLNQDNAWVEKESAKFFDLPIANDVANESSAVVNTKTNRRDFLKVMGFSVSAAALAAGCDAPVRRAIPYVTKPDAIVPGVPTYYASTFLRGTDFCPVLIKTREGRPIKVESNRLDTDFGGGTSARAQASVLDLYDSSRAKSPLMGGNATDWASLDAAVMQQLKRLNNVVVLSNTVMSSLTQSMIDQLITSLPNAKHVQYDPVSYAAMLDAHQEAFGTRALPRYDFGKADLIVSVDADFLGTWINPVRYAAGFTAGRRIKDVNHPEQNRLYVVESAMSLTGSNADHRVIIKPSQTGLALVELYNVLAKKSGGSALSQDTSALADKAVKKIQLIADDLWAAKQAGKTSLIVCGSNNKGEQLLTIEINRILGNFGSTITGVGSNQICKGDDIELNKTINDITAGRVDGVIILDEANPVYDTPQGAALAEALANVPISIALTSRPNETSAVCKIVAPTHHYLERWGNVTPYTGTQYFMQPTIEPLYDTRSMDETLYRWAGGADLGTADRWDYLLLRQEVAKAGLASNKAWEKALHDGYFIHHETTDAGSPSVDLAQAQRAIAAKASYGDEVKFYETVNIGAGNYASNPWLQEMPDPIYRTVWDNFVTVPVHWDGGRRIANEHGWKMGDIVRMDIGGQSMDLPVVDQFGVQKGAHGLALGYGHTDFGRAADGVGVSAYPMLTVDQDGYTQYYAPISFAEKVGKDDNFACVQYHHTFGIEDKDPKTGETINVDEQSISAIATGYQGALTDRSIFYHADLDDLGHEVAELKTKRAHAQHLNEQSIYGGHDKLYDAGHKWEMSIDLSSCIGCGACQVACVAENNVPVVGKEEVRRHHEMTWLRIDRYFYGDIESPRTAYQPMMCQHCDNAPCENVCPVGATQHSSEGLNHMTYNRCIGTRYCANNCPYKVRRFNWLDYTTADLFGKNENDPLPNEGEVPFYADNMTRMVLNPDVTVRSRGVIEKCSFCVQRIQSTKLLAKAENRPVRDGEVETACMSACPAGSIVFGDINNPDAEIKKREENPLTYFVLEETNVRAGVGYMMKVNNNNDRISDLDA